MIRVNSSKWIPHASLVEQWCMAAVQVARVRRVTVLPLRDMLSTTQLDWRKRTYLSGEHARCKATPLRPNSNVLPPRAVPAQCLHM